MVIARADIEVSDYSAEGQVLLGCVRAVFGVEQAPPAAELLDWERLIVLAEAHHVLPLLHTGARKWGLELPPETADEVARRCRETLRVNLLLTRELFSLTAAMRQAGIEAIPYKGPILTIQFYGDIALRQFFDLDIFIHRRDLSRAKALLELYGYVPDTSLIDRPDHAYTRLHHDYPFVHREHGTSVELQWGVLTVPFTFPPDFERWWARARLDTLAGQPLLSFAPEDTLLLLCMHGAKHLWKKLVWICDIGALIRTTSLDWDIVLHHARANGCERMVLLGVLLADRVMAISAPESIVQQAHADHTAGELADQVIHNLFVGQPDEQQDDPDTPFFYLRMMERLSDRLWLCAYCYPSLLRPGRLWRTYRLTPLKHLLGMRR